MGWFVVLGCTSPASNPPAQASESAPSSAPSTQAFDGGPPTDAGLLFDQCAAVAVEANEVPANILFILDSSGSMNCVPPDGDADEAKLCKTDPRRRGDGPSKWEVTYQSLTKALEPLLGRANLNVAVSSFPELGSRCDVPADPLIAFHALDADHLTRTTELLASIAPEGETPIAGASILGYASIAKNLRSGAIRGNAYIVVLTDGQETCKPHELPKLLEQDAPMAREAFGIRTFVIGAPGSEDARLFLSQFAHAGGTEAYADCNHDDDSSPPDCHFDMTKSLDFETDLARVLDQITTTKALTCEFDVPRGPDAAVDLGKVNVTFVDTTDAGVQRKPIGRHEGKAGSCEGKEEGWTYASDNQHILVCGTDCETVKASPDAQVQIVLGCPTLDRGDIR